MYAIVDIETTGNYTRRSKITEIAIFIHDGDKIVNQYHTLLNPEMNIPPYIESLTGITNRMVENAPKFYEVAKDIYQMLEGRIFIAHNVNFDYNFIRQEFKSLGGDFKAKKLCTVRLSRKILPGFPSYGLGNLAKQLKIPVNGRHRAAGDAEATVKIFETLLEKDTGGHIEQALKRSSMDGSLPPNLPKRAFESLPEATGVYYFHDQKGKVIYVGKAKNIKKRIKSHFSPGSETSGKQRLFREIHGLSHELCGNELVALLFETHEIQRLWPLHNRQQKRISWNYGIFLYEDQQGYKRLSISRLVKNGPPLMAFRSQAEAREYLRARVREYELCPKMAGIQRSAGACFDHLINQCRGACTGEEQPALYNKRMNKLILSLNHENLSAAIIGNGRHTEESSVVWVEKGQYLGFGFYDNQQEIMHHNQLKDFITSYPDNQDIQRIIRMYLTRHRDYRIVPLE